MTTATAHTAGPATAAAPQLLTYRWSSSDEADRVPVEDPATGEVIAVVQGGGPEEVDAAVEAAQRAFETDWRWRTPAERAALLLRGADVLGEHADELALLESRENGKPVQDARQNDISFLIAIFRFFGSLIDKLPTEFYDKGAIYTSTYLEPVGVVGEIIPFNWPPIHTGGKLAPALAVGNTVVIKPSEQDPLTVIRIVELLNTVLPPDVLHLVPGTGQRVGQPLTAHPKVRLVAFTGSTRVGAAVAATAAKNITPAVLELGGKDALVVFDDADLDRAVRDALDGGFYNKGEACTATSRILVQDGLYDAFVSQLTEAVGKLKMGRGNRPERPRRTGCQQNPAAAGAELHPDRHRRRSQTRRPGGAPRRSRAQQRLLGRTDLVHRRHPRHAHRPRGDLRPGSDRDRFSEEDEAVAIVNESEYGLTTAIYTADTTRGFRVARRIDVGMVFINNYFRGVIGTPFGGTKHSGYGREHAIETLREFSYTKMVRFPSGLGTIPSWRAVGYIFDDVA